MRRFCGCGCGRPFDTDDRRQVYLSPFHRYEARRARSARFVELVSPDLAAERRMRADGRLGGF